MKPSFSNFIINNRAFNYSILILIVLNVLAIMFESVSSIKHEYGNKLYIFNVFSVIVFTIEYFLRIIAHKKNRIKYIFSFYAIVDLLAILPFYIPFLIRLDLRYLRILRLLRVFRIFKTAKYSNSLNFLIDVLIDKKKELGITLFIASILMLVSTFLVYFFENPTQPNVYTDLFTSVWWSLATLTTVGYGDIYPVTMMGKLIGGFLRF